MFGQPLPETQPEQGSGERKKVLIVDDDPDMGELLCDRLQELGYEALHSCTGEEGLLLAYRNSPDLILLDLRLPGIDGLTVCQMLADDEETAGIPVIIVSGMEAPNLIRRTRAAGSRFFLRKPYDPNALLVLIDHALRGDRDW